MTYINITIKGVDEKKYRKIKGMAAEENVNVSRVVNEALETYIELKKTKAKKIDPSEPFFRMRELAVDYGIDTDVMNADKYIYQ